MQNLILNRYRPIQEAGKGGFATVQVAWDTRIQRRVAIKCLHIDAFLGGADAPQVPGLEEARTAALLSDPTIVGVYDFEIEGDMAYLIMEYVDGITLTQLMHNVGGPLPMDVLSVVFDSVSHALEIAHDNQVLHLDIKPDNVLINRQGQVKVTDFGLAQLSHEAGFGSATGGTVGYMPLEQMRMDPPDVRTDEWALASMVYEMLTGENPFVAADLDAAECAIENAEVIVPSVVRGDVHPAMDDVIFDALAIDREDRFDSVRAFADAIDPFLGDSRQGMKQLAIWVGDACEDSCDEDEPPAQLPVFSRMSQTTIELIYKFGAAAFVSVLGIIGLMNIPFLTQLTDNPLLVQIALVALLVMGCTMSPSWGVLASCALFVTALMANGAYGLGVVASVTFVAWWFVSGKLGPAHAAGGVLSAAFGAVGFGALAPLLAGYVLRMKDAICAAVCSVVIAFILASTGSFSLFDWAVLSGVEFHDMMDSYALMLVMKPATWITAVSWIVAAAVMSLACAKGYRSLAFVGALGAAVVLCGGVLVAAYSASGALSWMPSVWTMATTGVSCGIMAFMTLLGTPDYER